MPIYEFRCRSCRTKTTALVLARERAADVRCRHCNGSDLERLWSRFATVKSEESRMEALADPASLGGLDEQDPRSMMRWMKRMGQEMGEDLGSDFEEAMEQEMASGESDPGPGGADQPSGSTDDDSL
jgi:putative FmdB family regulatory protein